MLVKRGAKLGAEEVLHGRTPLHICAEKNHAELADMLILRGSNMLASGDRVSASLF